jgi:hypothetical protein
VLSSLYTAWIDQLLDGPIPPETKATCDNCAMLPQPGASVRGVFFHPQTKCCTYEPTLVNYRAGLILSDDDPDLAAGRRTVEERLRARVAVTPWGIEASARFRLLYHNTPGALFGRAPDLGCPHQIAGHCGIWRHRPATCATWFCKHVRGATGSDFWRNLDELLRGVDRQLGLWCALEMGIEAEILARLLDPVPLEAAELGGGIEEGVYTRLWGRWAGREEEFYRGCAELVLPLAWEDIVGICGTQVTIQSRLVRERYEKLTSELTPDHPRMGMVQIEGVVSGKYSAVTYSIYDPLRLSPELLAVLPHFDGRPSDEVLEEIRVQRGIRLDPALVRRMADFRVLLEDDSGHGRQIRDRETPA